MAKIASLLVADAPWKRASALRTEIADPLHVPLQLSALKVLFPNGLPRGMLTEISGGRSTGRASLCLHILAEATRRGEVCAVVDSSGGFSPHSAALAGVYLPRLLWVRCQGNAEHAMQAADLLLHAGGFGVVWLDLCEVTPRVLNRIPISYWHRYRRAIENTASILLACFDSPQVKSSFINRVELKKKRTASARQSRFGLWSGMEVSAVAQQPSERSRTESLLLEA